MITVQNTHTLPELQSVPLSEPDGERWQGISHHNLISSLIAYGGERGIRFEQSTIALSSDQQDMAATFGLYDPRISPGLPTDCNLSLGITTSNAKRFALTTYYGVTTIWGAGIPFGVLDVSKRHTFGIDIDTLAEQVWDAFRIEGRGLGREIERMKNKPCLIDQTSVALVEAAENYLLPFSRIGRVLKEIRSPTTNIGEPWRVWSVLHSFALIARMNPAVPTNATTQPGQLAQVNGFRELLMKKGK